MKRAENVFNLSLGLSIITWGFIGLSDALLEKFSLIRFFCSLLNIYIGTFFIFRDPIKKKGSHSSVLIALPSLLLGGYLFKMAYPFNQVTFFGEIIFVIAILFAFVSFAYLGKNFSILPNIRGISKNGPYKLIRHPSYASELIMTFVCYTANYNYLSCIALILFIFFLYFRIEEEEKLLSGNQEFIQYKSCVRWKVIPYVW